MGRKLTVDEIDFLFSSSFFMDALIKDRFTHLLIEHFCDCADEKKSSISVKKRVCTDRGLDSD